MKQFYTPIHALHCSWQNVQVWDDFLGDSCRDSFLLRWLDCRVIHMPQQNDQVIEQIGFAFTDEGRLEKMVELPKGERSNRETFTHFVNIDRNEEHAIATRNKGV